MLKDRNIDRICAVAMAVAILLTSACAALAVGGGLEARTVTGYAERLFDTSTVHTIDIVIDDWDEFLSTCESETYSLCTVVIDGEKFGSVGIRGKGNTSLSSVSRYGNDRYSFKIEFDHYQAGKTYYGLDKLCLNNLIQDKTMMKDYLAYTLMARAGVPAPLCSFVQINVNGEYWGLYLAVEAVEDAFLLRNYGDEGGDLYKPDSMSMGGGKGNGGDFRMSEFREAFEERMAAGELTPPEDFTLSEDFAPPEGDFPQPGEGGPGGFGGMGADDVKLIYADDDPESYANIFENAKTDVTDADQARLIAALKALNDGADVADAVDVEEVIRYFVVHSFLVNGDSYTGSMIHNYYLYEDDGVLQMLPWDYNLSLGAFSMNSGDGDTDSATAAVNDPIDTPVSGGDVTDRPMLAWIFGNEEYTALYREIYEAFMVDVYDSGWLLEEIDRVSEMIAPYVETDPTAFFTYDEFQTGVEALKQFIELRCQSVEGQLTGVIPSTTAGQDADASALIDASAIDLTDMGEMNVGGGPGGDREGSDRTGDAPGERPEMGDMPGEMPGMGEMPAPGEQSPQAFAEAIPLIAACVIALAAALVFAKRSRAYR